MLDTGDTPDNEPITQHRDSGTQRIRIHRRRAVHAGLSLQKL